MDSRKTMYFSDTIHSWDEAIPLGNGTCGALIWGEADGLRFSLDRGDIWDNTPSRCVELPDCSYETLTRLVSEKNFDKICEIFEDACVDDPVPSKLPAGKILFDFRCHDNVESKLDLQTAEATICIGKEFCVRSFIHAEANFGMITINQRSADFDVTVVNPEFGTKDSDANGTKDAEFTFEELPGLSLKQLHYPQPTIVNERYLKYFTQETAVGLSYGIFLKIRDYEDYTEIAYCVASSNDGDGWSSKAISRIEQALEEGYEAMFSVHQKWWDQYWKQSSVILPDKFFEKNWNLAQYFLACCSRRGGYPMPLQGVWTADTNVLPPWKGDYHLDLNVEMSYLSYLKANHMDEGMPLFDFLWNLRDVGRKFAKTFFHGEGLCMPSTLTITGDALGGWAGYSFSPTNQLWLCHMFYRHYCATGDRSFLEARAYPYMSESATFILSILKEINGKYYLPISTSPEIHDNSLQSYLTPNSNYDLALMRSLFTCLEELAEELAEELQNGEASRWHEILAKLPDLAVNEKGVLMLSPDEELQESHRHMSHAMSIYPLCLIPYQGEKNQKIVDATIFDLQRLGTGNWVGYSFPWAAEFYAIQKNGNAAAYQLQVFWNLYCSQNGFHLNGDYKNCGTSVFHYRPFTLEGNFCAADALQEMLLFAQHGMIELFPAIPDTWLEQELSFTDFCGEKGLLISAKMNKGIVTELILKPRYAQTVRLCVNGKSKEIIQNMDGIDTEDNFFILSMEAGKKYHYAIKEQI